MPIARQPDLQATRDRGKQGNSHPLSVDLAWNEGSQQIEPDDTGSRKTVLRVQQNVSGKGDHKFKYVKPAWDYTFSPLTSLPESIYNRLTLDEFITTLMLTLSPSPLSDATGFNAIGAHETIVSRVIADYERETGLSLSCAGFVAAGHDGLGRAEAHFVFQKRPDMIALKRICRKYGNYRVTGKYDEGEDWSQMSLDQKNHPPHEGCLHYTAKHAAYPEVVWFENAVQRACSEPVRRPELTYEEKGTETFAEALDRHKADQKRRKALYDRKQAAKRKLREGSDFEWVRMEKFPEFRLHSTKVGVAKPEFLLREIRINATTILRRRIG